jgi:hypothetical protein
MHLIQTDFTNISHYKIILFAFLFLNIPAFRVPVRSVLKIPAFRVPVFKDSGFSRSCFY